MESPGNKRSICSCYLLKMLPQPFECSLSTKLLSPTLFWLLCSTLPACYLKLENKFKSMESEPENSEEDVETKFTWNLLYESNEHGLTLNRFKNKVMGYKSPTILLMEISNNHILILALDQPWTDSADKFGGSYCRLIEAVPKVHVVEENVNMVYLKENSRALPTGLIIGAGKQPKVKIAPDLETIDLLYRGRKNDNVERIEVWGCGGVEAINSQADLKKWERKEVEKRKKVKLPGQWDTDKAILEMGGLTVNHSQRGDI